VLLRLRRKLLQLADVGPRIGRQGGTALGAGARRAVEVREYGASVCR